MRENSFWKVCEALDCAQRIELLRYLLSIEKTEFPCVIELADIFKLSAAAISVRLKKMAEAGLVVAKRTDRRVYYRAFASTAEGERVVEAFRVFFAKTPDESRLRELSAYVHALSHYRRNAIVRCLHNQPGLDVESQSQKTDIPPTTVLRLLAELDRVRIVDMTRTVVLPSSDPEATLLDFSLA